jgi:hypothetical protein
MIFADFSFFIIDVEYMMVAGKTIEVPVYKYSELIFALSPYKSI